MTASLTRVLRSERLFTRVLTADFISKTGDGAHELAFVLLALALTQGDLQQVGWIYFLRFLPYLVAGPLGGRLADVANARQVMLGCDLARATITLALALAVYLESLAPWGLALAGCAMTTFRTLFQPAFQATVPRLVDGGHLVAANGLTQISWEVGAAVGPALAGALLWVGSVTWVMAFDALTYLVACGLLYRVPQSVRARFAPISASSRARGGGDVTGWWHRLVRMCGAWSRACREISRSPPLFAAIVMSSVCILFVGAALRVMIPARAIEVGGTQGAAAVVASVLAGGTIAGAFAYTRRPRRMSAARLLGYWALYGGCLSMLPMLPGVPWMLLIAFGMGIAGACVDVVLATLIQRNSPSDRIGMNFGVFSTLANTGEAFSGVLAGGLVSMGGLSGGLVANGLLVVAAAGMGVWLVARRRAENPEVIDAR
ncbi:MFS transporter [Pandoraea pnomenusa]|uniref:MFS transporter n=1 Tax=Pandoraea pnomenusa TaxID=93220 RepID=UPI00333E6075